MDEAPTRVEVRIYGEPYVVRAEGVDAEHIRRLAVSVDERMKELARRNPSMSVTRIAVLTALNLADELWRLREQHRLLAAAFERRLNALEQVAAARDGSDEAGRP
ncbi:MAG TPA: cell division protein ZapA [Bacillota bacterium]